MIVLPFLLGILQILDSITTDKILRNGGRELNLLMAWLFKHFGVRKVLAAKTIVVTAAGFMLYEFAPITLIPFCCLYVSVVGWNTYQIYKG
jgi:hypothetical protein